MFWFCLFFNWENKPFVMETIFFIFGRFSAVFPLLHHYISSMFKFLNLAGPRPGASFKGSCGLLQKKITDIIKKQSDVQQGHSSIPSFSNCPTDWGHVCPGGHVTCSSSLVQHSNTLKAQSGGRDQEGGVMALALALEVEKKWQRGPEEPFGSGR